MLGCWEEVAIAKHFYYMLPVTTYCRNDVVSLCYSSVCFLEMKYYVLFTKIVTQIIIHTNLQKYICCSYAKGTTMSLKYKNPTPIIYNSYRETTVFLYYRPRRHASLFWQAGVGLLSVWSKTNTSIRD